MNLFGGTTSEDVFGRSKAGKKAKKNFIAEMLAEREAAEAAARQQDAYLSNLPNPSGQVLTAPENTRVSVIGDATQGVLEKLGMSGMRANDMRKGAEFVASSTLPGTADMLDRGDFAGAAETLVGGPEMGALNAIVPVVAARKLKTLRKLPDSDEFQRAVANTPGAKIDPDGVVLPVTRNQRPEQAGEESVRGGVFYLPEGSKDAKYYSGTNHNFAYGGTDKIKGETLLSNPLFAKGATGGKAPAAAYDKLMGKGAYEKMRTEVLNHAVTPYYIKDPAMKAEQVSKFLEKYAPELVGQEYEIIAKSTKGNQLAYALQEAAVASAVRRAGHDGVLGYSTSRKTKEPFISEVFDVRERTYPTRDGGFNVWDDYEN